MTRHSAILLLLFASFQTTAVFAADGPAKDVPELQALSNYIGKWNVGITSKDSPFTKGESTAEWILNGRFIQQSGFLTAADGTTVLGTFVGVKLGIRDSALRIRVSYGPKIGRRVDEQFCGIKWIRKCALLSV